MPKISEICVSPFPIIMPTMSGKIAKDSRIFEKATMQDIVDLDVNISLALLLNASGPLFKKNVEKWAAVNHEEQRWAVLSSGCLSGLKLDTMDFDPTSPIAALSLQSHFQVGWLNMLDSSERLRFTVISKQALSTITEGL